MREETWVKATQLIGSSQACLATKSYANLLGGQNEQALAQRPVWP